jgi:hypothetical protein
MRHSRTHHSRTSRNTHLRGYSDRLVTVLPDDRLADIYHIVSDIFPPNISEIYLRRIVLGKSVGGPYIGLAEGTWDKGVSLGAVTPPGRW